MKILNLRSDSYWLPGYLQIPDGHRYNPIYKDIIVKSHGHSSNLTDIMHWGYFYNGIEIRPSELDKFIASKTFDNKFVENL